MLRLAGVRDAKADSLAPESARAGARPKTLPAFCALAVMRHDAGCSSSASAAKRLSNSLLQDEDFVAKCNARRVVVGVCGVPGSGKSTISRKLVSILEDFAPELFPAMMPMDGFHYYRRELDTFPDPALAHARRGAPFTFDVDAFSATLKTFRTRPGEALSVPDFDHREKDPVANRIEISPQTRLLVVEGNYLGLQDCDDPRWPDNVRSQIDALVYVDIDLDVAMSRVKSRHMYEIGLDAEEAQMRVDENDRLNAELVAKKSKAGADFVVTIE